MTKRPIACQQFTDRLQWCADQRRSASLDDDLVRHAGTCAACRHDLDAWRQVESVLGRHTVSPAAKPRKRVVVSTGWSIAIAIALIIGLAAYPMTRDSGANRGNSIARIDGDDQRSSADVKISVPADRVLIADLDPAVWWHDVRNRDWVGQTMPAIESVQQGVAPLGRTLMRAVTILTTGGSPNSVEGRTS